MPSESRSIVEDIIRVQCGMSKDAYMTLVRALVLDQNTYTNTNTNTTTATTTTTTTTATATDTDTNSRRPTSINNKSSNLSTRISHSAPFPMPSPLICLQYTPSDFTPFLIYRLRLFSYSKPAIFPSIELYKKFCIRQLAVLLCSIICTAVQKWNNTTYNRFSLFLFVCCVTLYTYMSEYAHVYFLCAVYLYVCTYVYVLIVFPYICMYYREAKLSSFVHDVINLFSSLLSQFLLFCSSLLAQNKNISLHNTCCNDIHDIKMYAETIRKLMLAVNIQVQMLLCNCWHTITSTCI